MELGLSLSTSARCLASHAAPSLKRRAFRLKPHQGTTYFSMSELQLREDLGGADFTSPSTSITIGAFQDGAAANLIDNNTSNYCQQSPANSALTTVDLGSDPLNWRILREITIKGSPHDPDRSPRDFVIEETTDLVTWTHAWTVSLLPTAWTTSNTLTFTRPTGAQFRYWRNRMYLNQSGGSNYGVSTLMFAATPGGATICSGGTPIYRSQDAVLVAANAFDGSSATAYTQNNGAFSYCEYLGYYFPTAVLPAEIGWSPRSGVTTHNPRTGIVEKSSDGISWLPHKTYDTGADNNDANTLFRLSL